MRIACLAFVLFLSGVARAAPGESLSSDALSKLARCPTDASLCEEVAESTTPDALRAACSEKKPGACIAAAYATAATRRFRTPHNAAVRELVAQCDAGQHAACTLALEAAYFDTGSVDTGPYQVHHKDPFAVALPDRERLKVACAAGEWRACDWWTTLRIPTTDETYWKQAPPRLEEAGRVQRAACVAGSRHACIRLEAAEDGPLRTAALESLCREGRGQACLDLAGHDEAKVLALREELPARCFAGDLSSCEALVRSAFTMYRMEPDQRGSLCKQLRTRCAAAACGRSIREASSGCWMETPASADFVFAAERTCIAGKWEYCSLAARWYAKGVDGEQPEPEHAKWLAKRGCEQRDTESCAARVEVGEDPAVIAEELVARCDANKWSCKELLATFVEKRAWFERSPTVRAVLDKECRVGDVRYCRASIDAIEAGIGGKADASAAVKESLRVCEQFGGDCSDWKAFFRRSSTELARLRCLLFADRCDVAGIALPVQIEDRHCETEWGAVVGSYVVKGKPFGVEILDLATGKEAMKQLLFPKGSNLWHAAIGAGPDGFAAILDLSSRDSSTRRPHVWGPGFDGASIGASDTDWLTSVHSGGRRAWVRIEEYRSITVGEGDDESYELEKFVELVNFDLATGDRIGAAIPAEVITVLATNEDGTRLAVVAPGGVELVDAAGARRPVPTNLTADGLSLSGDGRRLAVWSREGVLELWDTAAPKMLWTAPGANAVFSRDGTRVGIEQHLLSRLVDVDTRRWVMPPAAAGTMLPMQDGVFVSPSCQILGRRPSPGPRPAWLDALPPFDGERSVDADVEE